jgi:hypothetical protein
LQIVDVIRKPAGMGADLRAEKDFVNDLESLRSLVSRGFYPVADPSNEGVDVKAANGEIHVGMKSGVEYILRFGETKQDTGDNVNRYMFVTARFDESKFPMPEPPSLPGTSPPDTDSSEPEQPASEQTPPTADSEEGSPGCDAQDPAADDEQPPEEATEPPPAADDQAESTEPPADAGDSTTPPDDAAESTTPPVTPDTGDSTYEQPTTAEDEVQAAERQRLEKEYEEKLKARNAQVEQGRKEVRDLNARFADWYYVISEDLFKKIHLNRGDIIQAQSGAAAGDEEANDIETFRQLEKGGLPDRG